MLDEKQALRELDRMIDLARLESDGCYHRKFGNSFFSIMTQDSHIAFLWGMNEVEKRTAMHVVQAYASP